MGSSTKVSLRKYMHVCTSHGAALPPLGKVSIANILGQRCDEHLAKKARIKPVTTNVSRYLARKAPSVARGLRKVLAKHRKAATATVVRLYAEKLQKDTGPSNIITGILEELNFDDLGVDLEGELSGAMLSAFKRAAAVGAKQVGFSVDDITKQVDAAAVAYAGRRGGELIKDLAGTTEDAMRSLLSRAVEEGMSADELSSAVEELGAFGDYRGALIARTELASAHVQGNVEGWKASGEVVGKRWILADTHDVPDECDDAAEAGVVDMDEDFGDGIDFPPAHPGCACDVLPVLRDDSED